MFFTVPTLNKVFLLFLLLLLLLLLDRRIYVSTFASGAGHKTSTMSVKQVPPVPEVPNSAFSPTYVVVVYDPKSTREPGGTVGRLVYLFTMLRTEHPHPHTHPTPPPPPPHTHTHPTPHPPHTPRNQRIISTRRRVAKMKRNDDCPWTFGSIVCVVLLWSHSSDIHPSADGWCGRPVSRLRRKILLTHPYYTPLFFTLPAENK